MTTINENDEEHNDYSSNVILIVSCLLSEILNPNRGEVTADTWDTSMFS